MKTKPKLKLYVWTDFCPDWSGGLAVAIARTEEEARKQVIKAYFNVSDWGTLTVYPLTRRMAAAVSGGS